MDKFSDRDWAVFGLGATCMAFITSVGGHELWIVTAIAAIFTAFRYWVAQTTEEQ